MKKKTLLPLAVSALMGIATSAQAAVLAVHSGSLSTTDGGILATSPWDEGTGTQVSWEVTFDTDTQLYEYRYEISVNRKDISGVIIEACQDCTVYPVNDLQYETVNALGISEGVYRPGHHGASTPGLPGTIAGVKFEGDDSTTMTVTITSAIAPVFGNIYMKDGRHHGDPVYATMRTSEHQVVILTAQYTLEQTMVIRSRWLDVR